MKFNKRKVLIAPLDWGLGHATRCIPLIRAFQQMNWEVVIAADGAVENLLRREFPHLVFLPLRGYRIKYSYSRLMLPVKIGLQVPKILATIRKEHQWLQKVVEHQQIGLVISDNRYGLYTEKVPCIFITHQLNIKAPFRWIEKKLQELNHKYISRFAECWVPDAETEGLAGELSHLQALHPFPLRYIGPLSRFKRVMAPVKYKYLFLLSGPEPQRSVLEKKIMQEVASLQDNVLIVRGKPQDNRVISSLPNTTIVNHLEGPELEKALNSAEFVISRSGYTTVMELAALQKRSILIPTPGQTEQEYLGDYLMGEGFAYTISQQDLDLSSDLKKAEQFSYKPFPSFINDLENILAEFVNDDPGAQQEERIEVPLQQLNTQ